MNNKLLLRVYINLGLFEKQHYNNHQQGYPANRQPELDFVEEEDKLTHQVSLDEDIDPEFSLDVFKLDPYFAMNEKFYEGMKKDLLCDDEDQESGSDIESDEESEGDQASSGKVSNSDTRSSHSSDSANSDENGRKRKRN
ncbi:unnamed protein product [Trifolium pratense]|uniref:Uncharacterized protein n=1 Tax=Trifolium pratense TaxID=57577 RepID=A0ACB0LPI6_TRIPR|nr:unnamed protein product [Trifolium pratense]